MTPYEQWWTRTPGPAELVERLSVVLASKGTAWITGSLPWCGMFRKIVKLRLEEINSSLNIEFVDISNYSDDLRTENVIFLFDESARKDYLPAIDLAKYIYGSQILRETIIWIYGLDTESGVRWLELSKALARQEAGLRIVCEGAICSGVSRNVMAFSIEQAITEFDTLLFAMTMIQDNGWNTDTKVYVSRLANELADRNAERVALLLNEEDSLLKDPVGFCLGTLEYTDEDVLVRAVRNSQIMSLYPRIEQGRTELVNELYQRLEKLVPFSDDFESIFEKPQDMELRHIVYFESIGELKVNQEEHAKLHFLYSVRNLISHRQIISGTDAFKLLS